MPDLSPAQKKYLYQRKREKNMILLSRILLFLAFLLLWEISARKGFIDSFIFSSPFAIAENFVQMCRDQVSLFPYRGDPYGNPCKFLFCGDPWYWNSSAFMGLSQNFQDSGSLSCCS